jgi:hypothetical protein
MPLTQVEPYIVNTSSNTPFNFNGANLGQISNVKITGGSAGQVILTDGNGNLSFSNITLSNTTSNLAVTDQFALPIGTTASRPASPVNGSIRINSETQFVELYYNGFWKDLFNINTLGTINNPATSATQLLNAGINVTGNYYIVINNAAVQCYVDFTLAGGPYILAMVAASTGTAYDYDSAVWTNTTGGVTTALDPNSDTNQLHTAFYNVATTRTGLALYQPSVNYFHYLDHTSGTPRNLANGATPPTSITPNGSTIAANNIIPATSPARALGWWNAVTAAGLTASTNGTVYYRYGYAHGTPDPAVYGYCRFGWTADQDVSDSRDRGIGIGLKHGSGPPVGTFSASAGRFDYDGGLKNNLRGFLYIKN